MGEHDTASLLRTLAHDLRNPLAGLRNALQLVRSARDPAIAAQALAMVERQGERLAQVVEDVVDLETLAAGESELARSTLDVAALADAAIAATAEARAQRGQSLAVTRPTEPLTLDGDEARLVRSLARVLERAGAATPREGRIALTVARDDAHAVLCVRDGGNALPAAAGGVPLADAGRAAPPVPSAASLPLVARVIALHGGTLAISRTATGGEVALSLPLADVAGRRILVVDDDRDTADVLCSMLGRDGHLAHAVYRGSDVLPAALAFAPDTVLLDIGLPDRDGYAVARDLRGDTRFARTRIYALSGYGQPLAHERSHAAGIDEHLTKPVELDRLRALLRAPPGS